MGLLLKLFGKRDPAEARESFAHLAIKALRVAGIQDSIDYDPRQFELRIRNKTAAAQRLPLSEFYREGGWPGHLDRDDAVARVAEAASGKILVAPEMAPTFDEAKLHLRPLIRSADEYDCDDGTTWSSKAFASVLRIGLGYDLPDSVARVSSHQLEAWDVSLDRALEVATRNLLAASPRPFLEIRPGVFASPYADVYDSSRLLLIDAIRRLPVLGDPMAIVPTRTCMLVTGSEDDDAVAEMLGIAGRAQAEEHPVSLRPLLLRPEGWQALCG